MRRSKQVWLGLGAGALVHNLTAEPGDTLSEAVDGWLVSRPILTRAVIAVLALHLANGLAQNADPLHWAFVVARRRRVVVVVETG